MRTRWCFRRRCLRQQLRTMPPEWTRGPSAPAKLKTVDNPATCATSRARMAHRSEEHTSELQSLTNLVCRLLLEKKNADEDSMGKGDVRRSGVAGGGCGRLVIAQQSRADAVAPAARDAAVGRHSFARGGLEHTVVSLPARWSRSWSQSSRPPGRVNVPCPGFPSGPEDPGIEVVRSRQRPVPGPPAAACFLSSFFF